MASTYTPIATYTVSGSSTTSYTFSSIPSTYTDLVLITNSGQTSGQLYFRINGDTGTNYSYTTLEGNGTSAISQRLTSKTLIYPAYSGETANAINLTNILHFQNYSNATTYKTILWRSNDTGTQTEAGVGLWRSTSAITSILLASSVGNFLAGSTFTLYGIKAA